MKNLILISAILFSNLAFAGNSSGGGTGFVPDENSEILWQGFDGDLATFAIKTDSVIKHYQLTTKELQSIDVKVGSAINASALSKNWEIVK